MTNPNPSIQELELSLLESQQTTFKQLERIQELEKDNNSLKEGRNERDKELVELREQYANACQTIADLQVKYGEAMSELNKLKHPF